MYLFFFSCRIFSHHTQVSSKDSWVYVYKHLLGFLSLHPVSPENVKNLDSGKLFIPCHSAYPAVIGTKKVEQKSYIVIIGYSCCRTHKCWILPKGDETIKECVPYQWCQLYRSLNSRGYQDNNHVHLHLHFYVSRDHDLNANIILDTGRQFIADKVKSDNKISKLNKANLLRQSIATKQTRSPKPIMQVDQSRSPSFARENNKT